MTNKEIFKIIGEIHAELDSFLAAGDREAIMKSIALLNKAPEILFRKEDGIRYTYFFQKIWVDETARGEPSIFADVHSVSDVLRKSRLVRHALWRLENDFPPELCLEAMRTISEMRLSNTAFREFLAREVENSEKVIARISEITAAVKG